MSGRLIAVVGPSGAGKDLLIRGALAARPALRVVRRVITRPADAGHEDFDGISEQHFQLRQSAGDFALDWQAHGLRYGIPELALQPLQRGEDLLFNGSRAALLAAAQRFPALVVILVTAPPEVLAQRLLARGREQAADRQARGQRAALALPSDLPPGLQITTIVNDGAPDQALARFLAAIDLGAATAFAHPAGGPAKG